MIENLWYKHAIIYSLDVGTFMDANGDGVGDFEGLTRTLDYLAGLGVNCLWLHPFQPSPNRDNGYDISDFYGVDPRHGSSGDFVQFMHHARDRGIRIIIDLVVNHTSDQHPWFKAARRDKQSPYRDWYIWSKKRPEDFDEGMVFPGVQESTWTYDKEAREWYYHRFYKFQPDLNTENPAVRSEIRRIIGYWIELGIAGFRLDAVPFVIEAHDDAGEIYQQFDYLHDLRAFLQWRSGDAALLGEANVPPKENRDYFGTRGDRMHMMFNFWVNQHLFFALATGDARLLVQSLKATRSIPQPAQWAQFLRNHDELDLGRLADEQRETVFAKFAPEARMQLYHRGIRRRLAPMLGDRPQIELAYSLLFALPGTPVLRYGDEIGMGDDLRLGERNAVRTPMQWSDEAQGGFSTAAKTTLPVIDDPIYGYRRVNVAAQRRDPASLLNWTARMIRIRKETPELGWGEWEILATRSASVLALRYDWRGNSVVTIHNLDSKPHEVTIDPARERSETLVDLIANDHSFANEQGKHRVAVEAYGYRWFRVGSLNEALTRERA